jgi:hypothetical protein
MGALPIKKGREAMKRMACVVALAAGSGLTGIAALPAIAESSPAAVAGLQVNIVPPGTVTGDSAIPLDVKFRGGNIRIIELFVDGTRLTRQALSTRDGRGVVHFSLDPSLLTEGSHEILVKAYEADGSCATTTTQIAVAAGDSNALARFEWPKRNAEVQGVVPIKIKIDSSIADPYVTYTIDNDFLALRNYAPYVYNWDTAKVDNGPHSIGIEVMDGRTLQVVQKLTIAISVKNVGGFTKIPPAANVPAHPSTGTIAETIEGVAQSTLPDAGLAVNDSLPQTLSGSVRPAAGHARHDALAGFRTNFRLRSGGSPSRLLPTAINLPGSSSPFDATSFVAAAPPLQRTFDSLRGAHPAIGAPDSRRMSKPVAPHIAPGLAALAADPSDLMPAGSPTVFALARQSMHMRRMGGIALRPSTQRGPVTAAPGVAPSRAARRTSNPAPIRGFRMIKHRTFDVAFNNTLINFDVAPRVEHGLPLAPFRAIFEHNGGKVKWFAGARVVRAVDNEREIEIKIGSRHAKVNNSPVSMDATPYLDHGRTIVPLSFVRDAMDLKVSFDEASGHLLIEKK